MLILFPSHNYTAPMAVELEEDVSPWQPGPGPSPRCADGRCRRTPCQHFAET